MHHDRNIGKWRVSQYKTCAVKYKISIFIKTLFNLFYYLEGLNINSCTFTIQAVQIPPLLYLFEYVQINTSHYIAMFIALLWFCTRLPRASLSTHQSCVKDTSASIPNMQLLLFFLHIKWYMIYFLTVAVKTIAWNCIDVFSFSLF